MNAIDELKAYVRQTEALGQVSGLLGWDQETLMPQGAADQRSEQMGAMEAILHSRRTSPQTEEWLEGAVAKTQSDTALLREVRNSFERNKKVPADLAEAIARATSKAQGVWAQARAAEDFGAFRDTLEEVVNLRRQEASALADGGALYEALLQDYEPGMKEANLANMLGSLRKELVTLREEIGQSAVRVPDIEGTFSSDQQMMISNELAACFGYDTTRGRLDKSVHPFSSGSFNDVRITTRVSKTDPFNCFYSTVHEVGHAVYEQNIDQKYGLTPLGMGASMGVHESQSRIFENQMGRSRAFTRFLFRRMVDVFGDFGVPDEDTFYAVVNKVRQGFIRTEADEVQYNLHVMLRFDLERALISGDLEVADLEAAWNDRFEADFGYAISSPANGVLQDVHWSVGLFGYFPTYSLGNVYAGELYKGLCAAVPTLHDDLAQGNTAKARVWLGEKIHQYGKRFEPADLMEQAVGHKSTPEPLLSYLRAKFGEIYKL